MLELVRQIARDRKKVFPISVVTVVDRPTKRDPSSQARVCSEAWADPLKRFQDSQDSQDQRFGFFFPRESNFLPSGQTSGRAIHFRSPMLIMTVFHREDVR